MKIAKYPLATFCAALLTVALTTPISSFTNIVWLSSMNAPLGFFSSLEIILFDFQRLGILLYGIIIIEFAIAFSFAGIVNKYFYKSDYAYAIAGAIVTGLTLFLITELTTQTEVLSGNRTLIGKILHCLAGFVGGYFFSKLISKDRNISFAIRTLGVIFAYGLLGLTLNWAFQPELAASGFGFNFSELSLDAKNALIRDFNAFFLASFVFAILGVITLNSAWFFSSGFLYLFAGIFNLLAIYGYETGFNQIFIFEFIMGAWPTVLGLVIVYHNKKSLS
ncbi:MAG: hypothetical protein ACJ0DL_01385 [Gammaproteobacteria bacterium]